MSSPSRGTRVLVTGGAGFVGVNVVEALLARGREVVVLDRGPLPPAAQRTLAPHAQRLTVVQGDLCDAEAVMQVHERYSPDGVIHCAAMTSGDEREAREPASVVNINLNGTLNVLAAAHRCRARRVVYVNSGSIYGETLYRGLHRLYEDTALPLPIRLYSITKHAGERACLRMRGLWGLDVVSARLGNVLGPWERDTGVRDRFEPHSQVIALAVAGKRALLPRREIPRDLVYTRDVAAGLILLLDAQAPRHAIYNLSSGRVWGDTLATWCNAVKTVYPGFEFRVAAEGETPNVTYSDRARSLMDMGRMTLEFGFRSHEPAAMWADFAAWLRSTPDFWRV